MQDRRSCKQPGSGPSRSLADGRRYDSAARRFRLAPTLGVPPQKKIEMAEYAHVVTFDADAAIDALNEIKSSDGPPDDVPAQRMTVLADRAAAGLS